MSLLKGGRLENRTGQFDLIIKNGVITDMSEAGSAPASLDCSGSLIVPAFVDMHTHLDKGHIWPRTPNPDGQFMSALNNVAIDRERSWSAGDVKARADFSIRCAYHHGTRAIRTHLDSIPPQDAISWQVFAELRDAWRGRVDLQMVSLAMVEDYRGAAGTQLAQRVADHDGVLGLVPLMAPGLGDDLRRFFELAGHHSLDVDMHIDETLDPASRTLEALADAVVETGYAGQVVAGHCCSLASQSAGDLARILDRVAEAKIAIVSLPMCNMYLQDRHAGHTPKRRGVTVVHELVTRGIEVAFASDNTRDPFYAYGDLDMHEVAREAVRIGHLDHSDAAWFNAFNTVPAQIMGIDAPGIAIGAPADFVIFEGRSPSEVLSRPETNRIVVRAGQAVDEPLPDYRELDHLFAG